MSCSSAAAVLPALRADCEVLRIGPQRYALLAAAPEDRFELAAQERFLLSLLDGRSTEEQVLLAYRRQFGRPLRRRWLREFIEQLGDLGLLQSKAGSVVQPKRALPPAEPPAPLSAGDPRAWLNHAFDLLAVVFGWLVHPVSLALAPVLEVLGIAVLVHHWGDYCNQLGQLLHQLGPLASLISLILLERLLLVCLPRELLVGTACRCFHGRVYGFKLHFFGHTLPLPICDVGDSPALMDGWRLWTLMTLRVQCNLFLAAVALLGWRIAPAHTVLSGIFLRMSVPAIVDLIFLINPLFRNSDGYMVLVHLSDTSEPYQRGWAALWSWLGFRRSREAWSDCERFWLRVYGVGLCLWQLLMWAVFIGLGGWWLAQTYGGLAWLLVIGVTIWWYHEEILSFLPRLSTP